MRSTRLAAALRRGVLLAVLAPAALQAQPDGAASERENASRERFRQIEWAAGPGSGQLGTVAEVRIPTSCRFTGEKGAKLFMEATENPADGSELGVLLCQSADTAQGSWFVVYSFSESGYVKDDERGSLDSVAILKTLRDGTREGNAERRSRGWDQLEIVGWSHAPFYDTATNNLTWATRLRVIGSTDETINHSVRLLGREGVMHADLVMNPSEATTALPVFNDMIAGYRYLPGHRYAEWREGDKVAEYGLTALVAGGAGVAAAKLGLFGKLWKLILGILLAAKKLIVVIAIAAFGLVKRFLDRAKARPALATAGGPAAGPTAAEARLPDPPTSRSAPTDPGS